ncbi:NAD(P)-dependent glycerol-3-phosphate dehydrogenase [Corticibacter populi]|uniref:Glycerol-3-phosphate dehydrogenase [NAD(P)+] n=1 Tax=Corticibacter populi TaxID=1550736 RepID=A0A3M6QV76_9BURK|nr:NAD(P)H-dependent glycerol-3-phosphate dehydrogenase [Corticibacter populi]RMX06927.1 NAD(P)-dependent glycerol-3-phosphate dehydrogenase [Corticibacter populi]
MNVLILGGGAWGTAVAMAAAAHPAGHRVTLWLRDAAQAAEMAATRRNARYLPQVELPAALDVVAGDWHAQAVAADLVVLGTPVAALRAMLVELQALGPLSAPVVWLCKGLEPPQADASVAGLLPHEVQATVAPGLLCGLLSGPSFALEVARAQPTALVAASSHSQVRQLLVAAFHGHAMRIYSNDDVTGVEVGGAVKNVLAIATGVCDGLELGLNARAALVTRGLAEMARLGVALGGRHETFMGLAGVGDLVLTATGGLSRNRKVGLLLAQRQSLAQILAQLGHVAEGVYCARAVVQRARQAGVEMPISQAVVQMLDGQADAQALVHGLLARDPAIE